MPPPVFAGGGIALALALPGAAMAAGAALGTTAISALRRRRRCPDRG